MRDEGSVSFIKKCVQKEYAKLDEIRDAFHSSILTFYFFFLNCVIRNVKIYHFSRHYNLSSILFGKIHNE